MKLGGWMGFLCLVVVAAREDNEIGASNTDQIPMSSSSPPLDRSKGAVCSPPLANCRLVDTDEDDVAELPECDCIPTDTHTLQVTTTSSPHSPQVVNESTIHVALNLTQAEEYKVYCSSGTASCTATVKAGYRPLSVEDLQCVSHNWEIFMCNWTQPSIPVATIYQPYLINSMDPWHEYKGGCDYSRNALGDKCLCMDTCSVWDSSVHPLYLPASPTVVVKFVVSNMLGNTTYNYTINNYAVVLPEAMSEVRVQAVAGQRTAVVRWKLPPPMGTFAEDGPGVVVRVDHRLAEGKDTKWNTSELLKCHADLDICQHGEYNISLEYWWRTFEVRVRLRSAAAQLPLEEDGWWSDWLPQYVDTPPTAPDTPPATGPGTFQVTDVLGDLTFTWVKVPQLLHNGSDFGYLAQVCKTGTSGQNVVQEVAVNNSFVVFHNLNLASPYTLRVAARNSEGRGPWAEVGVDPKRPALPSLLPVVQTGAGQDAVYELRWKQVGAPNYTIYLCVGEHKGPDADPCAGQLAWISVGNASVVNVTLQDFGLNGSAPTQAIFAVSGENAARASSGMSWDRCGASRPYTTARATPTLNMALPDSSGVELQWELDCAYWAGVVEGMEATWCRGAHDYPDSCTGGRMDQTTQDVWNQTVRLEGLEGGLQYTAWIRLYYRSGVSTWSEGATFTTSPPGVEVWLVVVVVAVGILATVVIILGLLYRRRKFVNNLKVPLQPSIPSGVLHVGSSTPNYVTPHFSGSESEARDTRRSPFSKSASRGGSQSSAKIWSSPGKSGGYFPPSEGTKLAEKKAGYGATDDIDSFGAGDSGTSGGYVSQSEGTKFGEK